MSFLPKSIFKASHKIIRRKFSGYTTVMDLTIRLTFIDEEGNKAVVPAKVGDTLLEAAQKSSIEIQGTCNGSGFPLDIKHSDKWTETVYGEGPGCYHCHVKIPNTFNHLLPEMSKMEHDGLARIWDEEYSSSTSRLACNIKLDKKHDGMVVFVPDSIIVDYM